MRRSAIPLSKRADATGQVARRAAAALALLLALAPCAASGEGPCSGPECPGAPHESRDAPCGIGDPAGVRPQRQFDAECTVRRSFAKGGTPVRRGCPPGNASCDVADSTPAGAHEEATVSLPPIEVLGFRESSEERLPTQEERFASALDRGNPIVAGGKSRHGAYHALGVYWGAEPLSFLYLNIRYGLVERD